MKNKYQSPQFDVTKITFSETILSVSVGESGTGGGTIHDPGEEEEE